jgi:hypothetical protein
MSESMIGHEMLNHLGRRITVTQKTIRTLDIRGYLGRDKETGLLYLNPKYVPLLLEGEWGSMLMRELGADISGPNIAVCHCRHCQRRTDLDDTRKSKVRAGQIVSEVRGRRRLRAF